MGWQCGSSEVAWLRLESPFFHVSILCKERVWWLAGWPGLTSANGFLLVWVLSHSRHVQVYFHDCSARSQCEIGLWRVSLYTEIVHIP